MKPIVTLALIVTSLFFAGPDLTAPLTMTMAESTPLALGIAPLFLLWGMRRALVR